MPRLRINDEDIFSGTGVEGRRKKRHENLSSREEPAEEQPETVKEQKAPRRRRGRSAFGEAGSADIFYTRRE